MSNNCTSFFNKLNLMTCIPTTLHHLCRCIQRPSDHLPANRSCNRTPDSLEVKGKPLKYLAPIWLVTLTREMKMSLGPTSTTGGPAHTSTSWTSTPTTSEPSNMPLMLRFLWRGTSRGPCLSLWPLQPKTICGTSTSSSLRPTHRNHVLIAAAVTSLCYI